MHLKLICCEIFFREASYFSALSPHRIDVQFMKKGIHDVVAVDMRRFLQEAVDASEGTPYDALILGYGLCNNGTAGLKAHSIPLVIPRVHDCINLFFGKFDDYRKYADDNAGVYFHSSGWIERASSIDNSLRQISVQSKTGMDMSYEELVKKYGEDNARYLYETLCDTVKNYTAMTFISTGIGPEEAFEKFSIDEAERRGWTFNKVKGDLSILKKMINGEWSEPEFIIVPPGGELAASYDESIFKLHEDKK